MRQADPQTPIATLAALIADIRFAMLTTSDADGTLHSRPMATQQIPFDGDLWFFTGRSTHKAEEVRARPQVNVSYAAPGDQRYVSVSGQAELVDNLAKAEELWQPSYRAWFPQGLEDPELVLLRVRVEQAEFWDSPSSAVVRVVGFVKAMVTGEPYSGGRHEHVDLTRR